MKYPQMSNHEENKKILASTKPSKNVPNFQNYIIFDKNTAKLLSIGADKPRKKVYWRPPARCTGGRPHTPPKVYPPPMQHI